MLDDPLDPRYVEVLRRRGVPEEEIEEELIEAKRRYFFGERQAAPKKLPCRVKVSKRFPLDYR